MVLVIAGAIITLVMNQYRSMRMDADVEQAKYVVNQIFGAAADFYQANCRIPINRQLVHITLLVQVYLIQPIQHRQPTLSCLPLPA